MNLVIITTLFFVFYIFLTVIENERNKQENIRFKKEVEKTLKELEKLKNKLEKSEV